MKSGKKSLRQLIESTINAWRCCDVPDTDRVAVLEKALDQRTHLADKFGDLYLREKQVVLGHEINDMINQKNFRRQTALLSAATIKLKHIEACNMNLLAENDIGYRLVANREVWLKIITTIGIVAGIVAALGWLVIIGIVPI